MQNDLSPWKVACGMPRSHGHFMFRARWMGYTASIFLIAFVLAISLDAPPDAFAILPLIISVSCLMLMRREMKYVAEHNAPPE